MKKRVVLAVILVVLSSFVYAGEKVQTSDIDNYIDAYKSEMEKVSWSSYNNMVGLANDVYSNEDGFTFYDIGEIIDTRGNRQKLFELWKDDEIFISSEGVVVNDHKDNDVVYTLSSGNLGISRTEDATVLSNAGSTKVDKRKSNNVIFNGEKILSGVGTDFFVPEQNVIHTNSKYTYNYQNRVGIIPNFGGIQDDYFQLFTFELTGLAAEGIPGTLNYNLLLDVYYNSGLRPARRNSVAVDQDGLGYKIRANCCSYIYFTDAAEENAFPIIARNNIKGDTGVILNKDVKILNSYEVTDGYYTYSIEPSEQGTVVKTADGRIIQSSSGMPYNPRNEKEKRLLENA